MSRVEDGRCQVEECRTSTGVLREGFEKCKKFPCNIETCFALRLSCRSPLKLWKANKLILGID